MFIPIHVIIIMWYIQTLQSQEEIQILREQGRKRHSGPQVLTY